MGRFVCTSVAINLLCCSFIQQFKYADSDLSCNVPLGVTAGCIATGQFITLSLHSLETYPNKAKLNSVGGYRAEKSDPREHKFVGVEFTTETTLSGVATQGFGDPEVQEWVTEYVVKIIRLRTGTDEEIEEYIMDETGRPKIFVGNNDSNTIVRHYFKPVNVTKVFLLPQAYHNNVAIRFELYECTRSKTCTEGADIAFILHEAYPGDATVGLEEEHIGLCAMLKLIHTCEHLNAAVVKYTTSSKPLVQLNFSHQFNFERFELEIMRSPYPIKTAGEGLEDALRVTANDVFSEETGMRPHVSKIAILFISCYSDHGRTFRSLHNDNASQPLKQKGVRVFVVMVASCININEVLKITERKEDLILKNTTSVRGIVSALLLKVSLAIDNPSIHLSDSVSSLYAGNEYSSTCTATGWPLPDVKWLDKDKELNEDDLNQTIRLAKKVKGDQINLTLHILDVDLPHAGNYTCEAANKFQSKRRSLLLSVSCQPDLRELIALEPYMEPNGDVTLRCEAYYLKPEFSYSWRWTFRQSREISGGVHGKYNIFSAFSAPNSCPQTKGSSKLRIVNFTTLEFGRYKCALLESEEVIGEREIPFYGNGRPRVPPRPEIVKVATINCGRIIAVEWKQPSKRDVTGYQVILLAVEENFREFIFNLSTRDHSREFAVQSNTYYELQIRAQNTVGFSQWAKRQLITTAEGPGEFTFSAKPEGCYVALSWTTPSENSCPIRRYEIHFKDVYTSYSSEDRKWRSLEIRGQPNETEYRLTLNCSKTYNLMLMAWNERGSKIAQPDTVSVRTGKGVPFPPELVDAKEKRCGVFEVTWLSPSLDSGGGQLTGYQVQFSESGGDWRICTINLANYSCLFKGQQSKVEYKIRVRAVNHRGPSEWKTTSAKTKLTNTPTSPDFNVTTEDKVGNECAVIIKWSHKPPLNGCLVLFYTIGYRQKGHNEWINANITDKETKQQKLEVKCSTEYEFQVVAWNEVGRSPPNFLKYTSKQHPPESNTSGGFYQKTAILTFIFAGLLLIMGFMLLVVFITCMKKRKRAVRRTAKDIQVLDHCEIPPIRTELLELLGEGAFGKVHKGKLKDELEYFEDERSCVDRNRKQKIVAVKELHENASEEEKKQFVDEIELMKKVGKHQNVLSFFGCWTTTKPLLLIVEYIPHGDLLHWLRQKKSQISCSRLRVAGAKSRDTELYAGTRSQEKIGGLDGEALGKETKMSETSVKPIILFDTVEQKEDHFDGSDECDIPLLELPTSSQNGKASVNKTNMLHSNATSSVALGLRVLKRADFQGEDECKVPMLAFSSSVQDAEEGEKKMGKLKANAEAVSVSDGMMPTEAVLDAEDQCKTPVTVFWSPNYETNDETADKECDKDCWTLNPTDLLTFAWQIARGMSYLSERGLVHRDLAARNILVGHGKKLKIGDFGLMRETYQEVYEGKKQKKLPIKWMAPESVFGNIFTSKSDVWSFGVVMWEVATLGGYPYSWLNNAEVMSLTRTGYRMEKPDLCSDNFYALMMDCWKQNPDERPSFQELVEILEKFILQRVEYFDPNLLDETKDCYKLREPKKGQIDCEDKLEQSRPPPSVSLAV